MSLTRWSSGAHARPSAFSVLAAMMVLAVLGIGIAVWAGMLDGIAAWIRITQRDLHRELASAIGGVRDHGAVAGWTLIGISFLYGVFHAAGPGHGKVVIATYLATQPQSLKRGILLSTLAALAQGITAIVAVQATVLVIGAAARHANALVDDLEMVSFALIALLGAILTARAIRRLRVNLSAKQPGHGHASPHEHHTSDRHGHDGHGHDRHGHDADCGHAHGPTAADLENRSSWLAMIGIVISIGIRPCSGAILVLALAHILGITSAGIMAVVAMSVGTAITVSALAIVAVHARDLATRLVDALPSGDTGDRPVGGLVIDGIGLIGGLTILAMGALLLRSAWTTSAHPLF